MKNEYHYDQDLLQELRQLALSCGPDANKHDEAIVLIKACIEAGLNTEDIIIGALHRIGCNPAHIAVMLSVTHRKYPGHGHWRRDKSGVYSLIA